MIATEEIIDNSEKLATLSSREVIEAISAIEQGCHHLYLKNKLQKDKLNELLPIFMNLAINDPVFLAHYTSYVMTKSDNKDIKLLATFASSLSEADGELFVPGGSLRKVNLRVIAQAAVQDKSFDPKQIWRLIELANTKFAYDPRYKEGTHFSKSLKTAIKKYVRFRETNIKALEGMSKAGFGNRFKGIYKSMRMKPSDDAKRILGWRYSKNYSKAEGENVKKESVFDFNGLKPVEIAEKIRSEKLSPIGVLGALPDKISPVVAVAILEQCSGNQAVILREIFDSQGLLKNKEVLKLFEEKVLEARTALDRVDRINTEVDKTVTDVLKKARSTVRKEQADDLGKIFLHLDVSSSMNTAISVAKKYGSIIAECVKNPEKNFHWGVFNGGIVKLQKPGRFDQEHFHQALQFVRASGATDMLANWDESRKLGCDVDIFITDCGHNGGKFIERINSYAHKPKAVCIIDVNSEQRALHSVVGYFENNGIPVSVLKPETLTQSANVVSALNVALKGKDAIVEEVMSTPLLKLPRWWDTVSSK